MTQHTHNAVRIIWRKKDLIQNQPDAGENNKNRTIWRRRNYSRRNTLTIKEWCSDVGHLVRYCAIGYRNNQVTVNQIVKRRYKRYTLELSLAKMWILGKRCNQRHRYFKLPVRPKLHQIIPPPFLDKKTCHIDVKLFTQQRLLKPFNRINVANISKHIAHSALSVMACSIS